jgi:hypothetical protein
MKNARRTRWHARILQPELRNNKAQRLPHFSSAVAFLCFDPYMLFRGSGKADWTGFEETAMTFHAVRTCSVSFEEFDDVRDWTAYQAVVSIHAHTYHSREAMAYLPRYIARIPVLAGCFEREVQSRRERAQTPIDFSKGWWHPPVSPREVFESEARQIENRFDMASFVSLTDHDDITSGWDLQLLYAHRRAPISFEWTVPYSNGYFHLGVHNLPPAETRAWFARLAAFTDDPNIEPLPGLLSDLNAQREVLIVLNHPWWDLAEVGADRHAQLLESFLGAHRLALHALELNGYRSAQENDRVRSLAACLGMPIISGGDRHGCAPNAILNLTAAESFDEFVEDVRRGVSHVVVMPEYRQHVVTRTLAAASDVLRWYPSHPAGRQHWTDRISYDSGGSVRPLSFHWPSGGPFWIRSSIRAFQFVTSPMVFPVIRFALETMDPPMGERTVDV